MDKFQCIIPVILEDYGRMKDKYSLLFRFLPIKELIFIGPESLGIQIEKDRNTCFKGLNVSYINENTIISYEVFKNAYFSIIKSINKKMYVPRVGWFLQQFIKMAFCNICKDEYYLSWDADTIPVRHVELQDTNGIPYFDIKEEYTENYFKTIRNLFGVGKVIKGSFISEHMLFRKSYMLEMIKSIEELSIEGSVFYEKILNAIDRDNLFAGFSEFETYGTWTAINHTNAYKIRKWKSFRNLNYFISVKDINEEDIEWFGLDFDAVSFEKTQCTASVLTGLIRDPVSRGLGPELFYKTVLEQGLLGEYKDGSILSENGRYYPI